MGGVINMPMISLKQFCKAKPNQNMLPNGMGGSPESNAFGVLLTHVGFLGPIDPHCTASQTHRISTITTTR